jgi:aryl-alcohol dehydrogenase-like predicted oxidoreductase
MGPIVHFEELFKIENPILYDLVFHHFPIFMYLLAIFSITGYSMVYKKIPQTELLVSRVCFGCMSLSTDHFANKQLLQEAVAHGVNFFDTAEETVGNAFKNNRHKIVLATKVGNQLRADGSGWDWNPSKAYILEAAELSLKRLKTDYIDIYQLHGGTLDDPTDETIDAFETLKSQGKIRHYGISSIRPNVIRKFAEKSSMVSVMMQYSLLDRRPEETCLSLLQQKKIAVIARGSIAGGLLIKKPAKAYLGHTTESVHDAQQLLTELASKFGRTPEESAYQFVWSNPAITTIAAGIRTKDQLISILRAENGAAMSTYEYEALSNAFIPQTYDQHR